MHTIRSECLQQSQVNVQDISFWFKCSLTVNLNETLKYINSTDAYVESEE